MGNLEKHIKYITNEIGIRVVGIEKENICADYIINELDKYGYSTENQNLLNKPFGRLGIIKRKMKGKATKPIFIMVKVTM